jgi:sporulation related protein
MARLYRVPGLDSAAWKPADKLPPVDRPVGADPEQGLVFVLDRKNNVVGIDLDTRRVRTFLENVRYATLGPDGALYAVDTASAVTQLVRRTPVRFRSKLQGKPAELHGTMDGGLIARLAGNRPALEYLGSDQPPISTPLPPGQVAATFLGDLVAVAADTSVVLYSPDQNKSKPRTIPIEGDARAVLFSPSGHRLYVARAAAPLLVLDRFEGTRLREIELPGPARSLRGDLYGNWLLIQPENADSVWVVDVGTGKYLGSTAAKWTEDLPTVAPPHTLLVRRGADLVALDLSSSGFTQLGRIEGGASDFWLPIAWHPADENALPLESDSIVAQADSGPGRPTVYLQVSSSQNPTWASELSERLRAAGLPASVLTPRRSEEAYRVVLGPYATREQAEQTGRKLGMPSFIVTAQDQSAQ